MKKMSAIALFIILAMTVAFAATGTARIEFTSAAQVNGTKLEPGNYKLSWTGEGDQVQVTFKSGKTVVTAPAKIVENKNKPADTSIVKNSDGNVKEIWFGGKTMSLVF